MKSAARIVREARRSAGLTQAELAARMGTTQSAVARLEAEGANPRVASLDRAVRAAGRQLEIDASAYPSGNIDETMTVELLRMTPADRLRMFEQSYRDVSKMARAAARDRGRVA